ncbi:hypothetical protein AM571_PA00330 (plasmid) [Rhizobium etli 8C-3]|uniref:Uncharacterized protein n=1 Tax=Rhizobium etli 8C-3 TaxID=538025 RepID=A0A1L5PAK9_RHIET|nr:hypothetical protein [Rhizobium etli]APO77211.1 hypothetical protein AM571_PA00330 [Rhizobium etli 8C-3]
MKKVLRMLSLSATPILIGAAAQAADDGNTLPSLEIPKKLQSALPLPMAETDLPSV